MPDRMPLIVSLTRNLGNLPSSLPHAWYRDLATPNHAGTAGFRDGFGDVVRQLLD